MEKWKKHKGFIIITSLITVIPVIAGIFLWEKLPDSMATHFDSENVPNGWSSKEFSVFGIPLFILGAHLLCAFFTYSDPKRQGINDKLFKLTLLICPAISLISGIQFYGYALELNIDMSMFAKFFLAVVFILVGNYMPKCRQNYTIGIKLPWTLADPENWNKTHRLASWLWIAAGLMLFIHTFLNIGGHWFFLILMAVILFIPAGYSFLYYMKHK